MFSFLFRICFSIFFSSCNYNYHFFLLYVLLFKDLNHERNCIVVYVLHVAFVDVLAFFLLVFSFFLSSLKNSCVCICVLTICFSQACENVCCYYYCFCRNVRNTKQIKTNLYLNNVVWWWVVNSQWNKRLCGSMNTRENAIIKNNKLQNFAFFSLNIQKCQNCIP